MSRIIIILASGLLSACVTMGSHQAPQPEPQSLYFDVDKAALRPASIAYLEQLSDFLNENEDYDVVVEGFTDSTASDDYNLKLSQRRAQAVQSYLASKGIAPSRTTTAAYGEQRPADDNQSNAGRQANRRVVVSTIQREAVVVNIAAPRGGPPRHDYTGTDPKIAGAGHNSGIRPTHR